MKKVLNKSALTLLVITSTIAFAADDPYFESSSSWGQQFADQWALHQTNFEANTAVGQPVVVAVIDTGLDFLHPDLTRDHIWHNVNDPVNGKDDDNNGYIDDTYGWDFSNHDNNPWDDSGHGTHVAGIIAANAGNGIGITGINPAARIMVLKAMNFLGYGRASNITRAIIYAVDNGAKVINLSLGGERRTDIEDHAINYAVSQGVVVVIAAGNLQKNINAVGIAGADGAITVGASGLKDERLAFSNYGVSLNLLAPGRDILSLRARRTDFALLSGVADYQPGSNYVGAQKAYYRASGTSFAAPIVAGAASLLLSQRPNLTGVEVRRMLLQSARDAEIPGVDSVSGHGILNIKAALAANPEYFIEAVITGVQPAEENGQAVAVVYGTAQADRFEQGQIYLGEGVAPRLAVANLPGIRSHHSPVSSPLESFSPNGFNTQKTWCAYLVMSAF